jgi:hypothetical protein
MRKFDLGFLFCTSLSMRRFAIRPRSGPGFVWLALGLVAVQLAAVAAPLLQPSSDDQVIEVLPAVTRGRPPPISTLPKPVNPAAAQLQARQDIGVARQTGDTRYWGRAQAVLAPWWDRPDAPADIAVLQATVQQGRHEFAAARQVLAAALARTPGHAQGWLDMAALERLSGHYPEALAACDAVARAGQALYASACRLETQSLQGHHETAVQGLQALIAQTSDNSQRSWLLSVLAESQERWGRDGAAAKSYTASLALDPDLYTAIAYSDLLLRTGKPAQALQALAALPETDAVVLRRSAAWRRLGDSRWTGARAALQEREAELKRHGDDPALHARELALAALWLDDNAVNALAMARRNLLLQREPIDWWVALLSARQAGDGAALAELDAAIAATGLQDARLIAARRQPAPSPGKAK